MKTTLNNIKSVHESESELSNLKKEDCSAVAKALNGIVSDSFVLYMKTKNFHWHMHGPHFRDYHLLLDEQAASIYASIDPIAERVRKLGEKTITSLSQVLKQTSLAEVNSDDEDPHQQLQDLLDDNKTLIENLRNAHNIADEAEDLGTTSLLEVYIDEAERRAWFLFQSIK